MIDLTRQRAGEDFPSKLLLIEDDASVVASLRLFLKVDYEVHSASTRKAGIGMFKKLDPSLVVLDLRLPDGDGLEVLREIRAINARAPVIVLTGYASMKSVEESLRFGASDFLHKPFDGFMLKSRIDELVTQSRRSRFVDEPIHHSLETALQRIGDLELKANASAMFLHDVASPVTTALTAAHFLYEEIEKKPHCFSKDVQDMASLLFRSMGFISGLFEQSRSIECLGRLQSSDVAVHKIADLAMDLIKAKARERKVIVLLDLQDPNLRVHVNAFALARVLVNLIHNGIEAVNPVSGRVRLVVETIDGAVDFSVIDNGQGIPKELADRIFEARFTTKAEGSGLGLYISKHLITGMGGVFRVRNEEGQGCCFSIRIPSAL